MLARSLRHFLCGQITLSLNCIEYLFLKAAVTTKAADSQTTAAVDVEPTVRRGGRGRGRKGTTAKETAQVWQL